MEEANEPQKLQKRKRKGMNGDGDVIIGRVQVWAPTPLELCNHPLINYPSASRPMGLSTYSKPLYTLFGGPKI